MEGKRETDPYVVILTPNARQIPRSVLHSGTLITDDFGNFSSLVLDRHYKGFVNLSWEVPLERIAQLKNVSFYIPLGEITKIQNRIPHELDHCTLRLEGEYFWVSSDGGMREAVGVAVQLSKTAEQCARYEYQLSSVQSFQVADNKSGRKLAYVQQLELVARRIYPKLPPILRSAGLKMWNRASRRS